MADYRQTVAEAAEILDAIRRGDSDWVIDESLVPRLRAGLAPALEQAREEERKKWLPVLAALERLTAIYEDESDLGDPSVERPAWLRDALALRTIAAPPPPGTGTPPSAADAEPFCVCGRRVSECDGSRAGCRTQCREEASHG
jgi:hypothetical protein